MTCPDAHELTLYAELLSKESNETATPRSSEMEQHFRSCSTCREQVETERAVLTELLGMGHFGLAAPLPPSEFFEALQENIVEAAMAAEIESPHVETHIEADPGHAPVVSLFGRFANRVGGAGSGRMATGIALAAAACVALMLSLPTTTNMSSDDEFFAGASAEELEVLEEYFGGSLLLGEALDNRDDSLLDAALISEADDPSQQQMGDALPLLEGLSPTGLTNAELEDLLNDWENRG